VEPNERRRERIESLGFTALDLENAHMGVLETLGGELPHAVFECAGHPSALGLGLELVRPAGTVVALGVLEEPVPINQLLLIVKEATVRGSFAYSKRDFAAAIALVAAGELPGEKVITEIAPLERAWELFNDLSAPGTEQMKVLLRP
jgi:threonine dehydrogenase-like Zn-dependent dehydrogenase